MKPTLLQAIVQTIVDGGHVRPDRTLRRAGGGCISEAWEIGSGERRYFVKVYGADGDALVRAEADALTRLAKADSLRTPQVLGYGCVEGDAYLVLEHIRFAPPPRYGFERLAEGLADLHRLCGPGFGFEYDNFIGSTPQPNGFNSSWSAFFRDRRLGFQLRLAARQGYRGDLLRDGEQLLERVERLLDGHAPEPSLLHGDLWSGNVGFDKQGAPVLYDPACYYGDRETDLAMTSLFGGFPTTFHEAYAATYALNPGYPLRRDLYQLYHVLNHLNLFGGGYLAQARRLIQRLLAST